MKAIHHRYDWVDALRGVAIVLMVPANFAPYLADPHPFWFRIASSLAAPIFIMVSAGMAALTAARHDLRYYLARGGAVLLIAMGLDVLVWQIVPGTSFDVLYLIGASLPLAFVLRNASVTSLFALSAGVVTAGSLLRTHVGYDADPLQIHLFDPYAPQIKDLVKSWLISGWFPILPWAAFTVVGLAYFRTLLRLPGLRTHLLTGGTFTVLGMILLFLPVAPDVLANLANGAILEKRQGYSEIFYPATLAFVLMAAGVAIVIAVLMREYASAVVLRTLSFFGRYSMLVYVLHLAVGVYLISPALEMLEQNQIQSGMQFLLLNLVVLGSIAGVCLAIGFLKARHPPQSLFLQVIVGR
jgi:uncharacterized membrane protein